MLRIALRLQRSGTIAVSVLGAVIGMVQAFGFKAAAGTTPAARLQFAHEMGLLARQISYLLPPAVGVETLGGYVQWRVYGTLPLFFGIWAGLSASGAVRGDEERGLVDLWRAAGVTAVRYVSRRATAFAVAATGAAVLTGVAVAVGATAVGSPLEAGAVAEATLAVVALSVCCYGIALVVAQLAGTRRAAAGVSSMVLLGAFLVNSLSRSTSSLEPLARVLSPFYYFDLQRPLAPGGAFDAVAVAGLLVAGVVFAVLGAVIAARRDSGSPLLRRAPRTEPADHAIAANPLLRHPVLESLYEQRLGLVAWIVGTALMAAFMASVARQTVDVLKNIPAFLGYLALAGGGNPDTAITGLLWGGFAELLLAALVITTVSRWVAEDTEGRLEIELSAPRTRWRVVADRAIALMVTVTVVAAAGSLALALAASGQGISLDAGGIARATALLVPFGLTFGAAGAVLAGSAPRLAMPLLGAVAAASYFGLQLAPLFKAPEWVTHLSVFSLYGNPLTGTIYWTGLWTMLGVIVVGFGLGIVTMQRREVGR